MPGGKIRKPKEYAKPPKGDQLSLDAHYVIDTQRRVVLVKFGEKLTATDIERYAEQLRANPSFRPGFSEIVDLTQVVDVELRGEDILRLADHVDPFSFESKRAFVVKDSAQSHQARMYQISRMAREKIRSFYSHEDAERWLFGTDIPEHS